MRKLAEAEGVSINHFISTAVAQKMAVLMTDDYLAARAKQASKNKFRTPLDSIPDRPADERDAV